MRADRPVLIAGGGIAGFAAAIALAKRGHSVAVYEARANLSDSVQQEGAGIQIGPNGVKCLRALGIDAAVAAEAATPTHIAIKRAVSGQDLAALPLAPFMSERHGAPYWTLRRQALHRALLEAARHIPAIAIFDTTAIASPRPTASGVAVFAAGEIVEGRALIIADGAGSTLRAHIDNKRSSAIPFGWSAARAVVPRPASGPLADNVVGLWFAPSSHVVHYPVEGGRSVSIVAITRDETLADEAGQWDATDRGADVAARIGGVAPPLRHALEAISHWRKWQLFDSRGVLASPWTKGPMVAIGDAAHPVLPYLAQGAVMALEDAVTLGQVLPPDGDVAPALAAMERLRRPRIQRVAATAQRNGLIYHQSWSWARDAALRWVPPDLQLRTFDWLYGHDASRTL